MNTNKIELTENQRFNLRINYYVIQQTWHAKLGRKPRDFDIYAILGIKRQRYYKIIADNSMSFTVGECKNAQTNSGLPLAYFIGEDYIETGISLDEWGEFFDVYNEYRRDHVVSRPMDVIDKDFHERKNKIDNHIKEIAKEPPEKYKGFKMLCTWFESKAAYMTLDATRFIKELAGIMENRMTLTFIQQCDKEVLDEALRTYASKYELMKAVQTCNNQERLEEEQKLSEKKKK